MPYMLREGISYCDVGGHLVFLDVSNDRYLRLPKPMERRFLDYMAGHGGVEVRDLADHGLLLHDPDKRGAMPAHNAPVPTRSAMERDAFSNDQNPGTALTALLTVFSVHMQLKVHRLSTVLHRMASYRARRTSPTLSGSADLQEQQLVRAVAAFRHGRRYAPIPARCLLDSVSLVVFLAKHRLYAHLVFGVTAAPFSAHCWAQHEDLVLNDALGHVNAHVPIRTI